MDGDEINEEEQLVEKQDDEEEEDEETEEESEEEEDEDEDPWQPIRDEVLEQHKAERGTLISKCQNSGDWK